MFSDSNMGRMRFSKFILKALSNPFFLVLANLYHKLGENEIYCIYIFNKKVLNVKLK